MEHTGQKTIKAEASGLAALARDLDVDIFDAVVSWLAMSRLIIWTGIGKSGHVARKLASTATSMGSPSIFVHPVEAAHGDLGVLSSDCALVVLSRSGSAAECWAIMDAASGMGCQVILISEDRESDLAIRAKATLILPKIAEAWGHAPTVSTTLQMALGDAIAVALAEKKSFTEEQFRRTHPGGVLGGNHGRVDR